MLKSNSLFHLRNANPTESNMQKVNERKLVQVFN